MANLDKTGIVTGQDITAAHITALYDALTGATKYDNVNSELGVEVYRAKITTTFDGSHFYPTITELENSLGITSDTQSLDDGHLYFEKTGSFSTDKIFLSWSISDYDDAGSNPPIEIYLRRVSDDRILLNYWTNGIQRPPLEDLTIFIEIIVYP